MGLPFREASWGGFQEPFRILIFWRTREMKLIEQQRLGPGEQPRSSGRELG